MASPSCMLLCFLRHHGRFPAAATRDGFSRKRDVEKHFRDFPSFFPLLLEAPAGKLSREPPVGLRPVLTLGPASSASGAWFFLSSAIRRSAKALLKGRMGQSLSLQSIVVSQLGGSPAAPPWPPGLACPPSAGRGVGPAVGSLSSAEWPLYPRKPGPSAPCPRPVSTLSPATCGKGQGNPGSMVRGTGDPARGPWPHVPWPPKA